MKARKICRGETIAIVSLSSGILGENFIEHELKLAEKRLTEYGFKVKYTTNALKGVAFLNEHPEARASDLLEAFKDNEVKAIICAIGGEDTYRLTPYLFNNNELKNAVEANPKMFLGFSDTTVNHLMLYKCGLNTFYGQSLLADIAELDKEMLPYSKLYFEKLFLDGSIDSITPSDVFYDDRMDFSVNALGTSRISHLDSKGFVTIKGNGVFEGKILGGCIESLSDMITGKRFGDEKGIVEEYSLFPSVEEWKDKILLLESSEETATPDDLLEMLLALRNYGVLDVVSGVIVGKPMNEMYYNEYIPVYLKAFEGIDVSIVYNINIGHATPRCIIPFGIKAYVDADRNEISFKDEILER